MFPRGRSDYLIHTAPGITQIFVSDKKFYIRDEMNDEIYEIASRNIHEIADILGHGGP